MRTRAWLVVLAAAASPAAGCGDGGGDDAGGASTKASVTVYSSLPLQGAQRPQTTDMVKGIELALAQVGGRAGDIAVKYESLTTPRPRRARGLPRRCRRTPAKRRRTSRRPCTSAS